MRRVGKIAFALAVLGLLSVGTSPVGAQSVSYITHKDLEVAVRVFNFVYGMPRGALDVDIVYDPNNSVSTADAEAFRQLLSKESVFASRPLRARLVPLSQLGTLKAPVAYVTQGLQRQFGSLYAVARNRKILTFSTDFDCVESQTCVMGMAADPGIRIEISRSVAADSSLEFSQALKLMIHEVE